MQKFKELTTQEELLEIARVSIDDEHHLNAILDLLSEAPHADEYIRVVTELPEFVPGQWGLVVSRTRLFIDVQSFRPMWGDAMVAIAAYSVTQSAPAAFFASIARKAFDSLSLLSDDEAEVVRDFFALSSGRPYDVPIREADLRLRFVDTVVPLDEVLDALQRKKIITKRRPEHLILMK